MVEGEQTAAESRKVLMHVVDHAYLEFLQVQIRMCELFTPFFNQEFD